MARLNPILVRELRQAARGGYVMGFFLVFLAFQLAATVIVIIANASGWSGSSAGSVGFGSHLFAALLGVLVTACLWFVPLYSGVRLALENNATNADLYFITTLTAGQIIRGKLCTAAAITLLAFSASAPFMAMSVFLRGVDVVTIIVGLVCAFAEIMFFTQAALFVGSMSTRSARGCFGSAGLGCMFFITMIVLSVVGSLAAAGAARLLNIPVTIAVTAISIIAFLMLYGMAIGMLGPQVVPWNYQESSHKHDSTQG